MEFEISDVVLHHGDKRVSIIKRWCKVPSILIPFNATSLLLLSLPLFCHMTCHLTPQAPVHPILNLLECLTPYKVNQVSQET